jgi:hypothetical protein
VEAPVTPAQFKTSESPSRDMRTPRYTGAAVPGYFYSVPVRFRLRNRSHELRFRAVDHASRIARCNLAKKKAGLSGALLRNS